MKFLWILVSVTLCGLGPSAVVADKWVYRNEVVVLADGPFCPWFENVRECPIVYGRGVHLFGRTESRELIKYDRQQEKRNCDRFRSNKNWACSANFRIDAAITPNDPWYKEQWAHKFIRSAEAWRRLGASNDRVVVVVDTGVAPHEDLELIGEYDAFSGEMVVPRSSSHPHGTHVAGICCAKRNNKLGVAGVSNSKIYSVRVLGQNGSGSLYVLAKGLNHAYETFKEEEIKPTINLSLGSRGNSAVLAKIVSRLVEGGFTVVAAAGNSNTNNDNTPYYPANYEGVISVGALEQRGARASFSNYGESVDVMGPGKDIISTVPGGYKRYSGSSMAAPLVAGIIAATGKIPKGRLDFARLVGVPDPTPTPTPCMREKFKRCFRNRCWPKYLRGKRRRWRTCRNRCKERYFC